jgi:hypothetical protein
MPSLLSKWGYQVLTTDSDPKPPQQLKQQILYIEKTAETCCIAGLVIGFKNAAIGLVCCCFSLKSGTS